MPGASHLAAIALCLVLAGTAAAQTQNVVWLNDSAAGSGASNTYPWSQIGVRYQCLVKSSQLGDVPHRINDVFVAPQLSMAPTVRTAIYDDIEIRMGLTDVATLQTDWTKNNPKPTTLYRGPLRVTFEKGAWRGLGLPQPFAYAPKPPHVHLCFEVIIWSADPTSLSGIRALTGYGATVVERAYYYLWTSNQTMPPLVDSLGAKLGFLLDDGNFVVIGEGCPSSTKTRPAISSIGWPQVKQPFEIFLDGARPTSPAVLVLGLSFTDLGSFKLPFDLAAYGAPDCLIWNDYVVLFGAGVDAQGRARLVLPALPPLAGARAYFHWLNFDPTANKLGLTTSSLGKLLGGS